MIAYTLLALAVGFFICILAGKSRPWVAQAGYAGTVVACLITAAKLVEAPGGIIVSVAIGLYSMSFLLTDFLGEIYGRPTALRAVYMGIIAELLIVFAIYASVSIGPAPFWVEPNEAFSTALGAAPRIMVASVSAFVLAQLLDVTAFDYLKRRMKGRMLFVRNNLSTVAGQAVDTVVFYTIAFLGVPGVNIVNLILVTCIAKFVIAVVDTPFLYAACALAGRTDDTRPIPHMETGVD